MLTQTETFALQLHPPASHLAPRRAEEEDDGLPGDHAAVLPLLPPSGRLVIMGGIPARRGERGSAGPGECPGAGNGFCSQTDHPFGDLGLPPVRGPGLHRTTFNVTAKH